MPPLIAHLTEPEQVQLLEDLNYLNTGEIKAFSDEHSIPYSIWIETKDGGRRKTRDDDRKGVMLDRIRHYLRTGEILDATCFPSTVVCFDALPKKIDPTDKLFYGQYDKNSSAMVGLLKELTDGQFENGAIARMLAREFWSKGIAPSFQEYAVTWLIAKKNHTKPNPEWAFLSNRTQRKETVKWKQLRIIRAESALYILNKIGKPEVTSH